MPIKESTTPPTAPLWRLAFRAGFLLSACFAVAAMSRWMLWLERPAGWPLVLPPHWWHGHEMVFGFAMPVIAGFLLTAVATWTGTQGTTGRRLQLLFGLWLCARLVLWLLPQFWALAAAAEVAFLLLTAFELGKRVWPARQWRNLIFLPILLALIAFCFASYAAIEQPLRATRLHYGAVWMAVLLVVIVGGRVIPLFTANGLQLKLAPLPVWFEYLVIAATALVALATIVPATILPPSALQILYLLTAALQAYRLWRWQGWKTLKVPLLWSMHLSYLCIVLGLLGLAVVMGDPLATKNCFHLLAVGTVGGMILTMMSRVSLGHTGRPLNVPTYLAMAFAGLLLAAFLRAFVPIIDPALSIWAWRISGLLWVLAFALFLLRNVPILLSARADGKPG